MNNKILLSFTGLLLSGLLYAQDVALVFKNMPQELIMTVDSVKRLDLMDLYNDGFPARVMNSFNDTVVLKEFTSDYLLLKTGQSVMEVALLPMINDSKIICLINTVCAPVCDSRISFYTTEWKLLPMEVFFTPVESEWFVKEGVDKTGNDYQDLLSMLDMNLMMFHIEKNQFELVQTFTTPDYLSKNEQNKVKSVLKSEPKVFSWNKTRFN